MQSRSHRHANPSLEGSTPTSDHRPTSGLTRRGALQRIGGAGIRLSGLGALGGAVLAEDEAFPTTSCKLTAEQERGPYHLGLLKIRRNITEGKAGAASIGKGFVGRITLAIDT